MVNDIKKFIIAILEAFATLGKKIDVLDRSIKNQKPPVFSPKIEVSVPDVIVPEIIIPEIVIPEIKFPDFPPFPEYPKFPEIKLPPIKIPKAEIVVNVKAPIVHVPPVNITVEPTPVIFPKQMEVKGMGELIQGVESIEPYELFKEVSSKNPVPVILIDDKGKVISRFGGEGGGGGPSIVGLKNNATPNVQINPATKENQDTEITKLTTLDATLVQIRDYLDTVETKLAMMDTHGANATSVRFEASVVGTTGFLLMAANANRKELTVLSHGTGHFHVYFMTSIPTDYISPIELMENMHDTYFGDRYTGAVYGRFHPPESGGAIGGFINVTEVYT